ncbi:MAG: glutaredoxin family protein [Haloarculaceae archaeon]
MVEVTVYSREECHLCEEALATIRTVAHEVSVPVDVAEVDVDDDPELAAEYGERVPYVFVDGRPAFKYRVDADELRDRLTG